MKIIFSTRQIPSLRALPLAQRLAVVQRATQQLSIPEKTLLNVLKLLIIVPAFFLILRAVDDWSSLLWALVVFWLYPICVTPIQLTLTARYLLNATSYKDER
jgi:hypothetical protein